MAPVLAAYLTLVVGASVCVANYSPSQAWVKVTSNSRTDRVLVKFALVLQVPFGKSPFVK